MHHDNDEIQAYTVPGFCRAHNLSVSRFYTLEPADRPRLMRIGRRVYVTAEAAADWRREMERRTKQAEAAALAAADQQAEGRAA